MVGTVAVILCLMFLQTQETPVGRPRPERLTRKEAAKAAAAAAAAGPAGSDAGDGEAAGAVRGAAAVAAEAPPEVCAGDFTGYLAMAAGASAVVVVWQLACLQPLPLKCRDNLQGQQRNMTAYQYLLAVSTQCFRNQ